MTDLSAELDLALYDLEGPPADYRTVRDSYRDPEPVDCIMDPAQMSPAAKQAIAFRDQLLRSRT